MPFGAGTYSMTYNWETEALSPPIEIAKLQAEFSGIATGLSTCILRDGTGLPVADIPWNGQKITGLGTATAGSHAMSRDAGDARYPLLSGANTFTVKFTVSAANPGIWFNETDATANNRLWDWNVQGEQLQGRVVNDAINASANWVTVDRDANTVDLIAFAATSVTVNGQAVLTATSSLPAANLTGTIADARFPATLPAVSGANLTALNATQLTSGTVPDARFPATLPAVSGANLTSLPAGNLTGSIADARVPASAVTQHQASILAGSAKVPVSTTATTLVAADAWKCVDITADIAVPNSTFTAGDIVTIYNNSSSAKNITRAAGTQYKAGTDGDDASISLAARGFATIRFRTATEWTVSGNVT